MDLGQLLGKATEMLDKDGNGLDLNDLKNLTNLDLGDLQLDKLFSGDFMSQFSKLDSIGSLFDKAGITSGNISELNLSDLGKLNEVIPQFTQFGNWQEMLSSAKNLMSK